MSENKIVIDGLPYCDDCFEKSFGDEKDSVKENYDQVHYLEFAKHVDELVLCTNCDDDVWGRDHTHLEDRISYYKQLLCEEKRKIKELEMVKGVVYETRE